MATASTTNTTLAEELAALPRSSYRQELASLHASCLKAGKSPDPILAAWGRNDLFFLLVYLLGREDADNDWCYDRCREVQAEPNGCLDLWARGHYKSTIITFGLTIQDILNDPEITAAIFSHTRPIAKAFLRQIMREFEQNEDLKRIYADVLYADPRNESPKWSEDEGICVKRQGNPKEQTVEAWGLVDGQPTSKHFKLRVYDDTVTKESVTTPEMMQKTTEALQLSYNLTAHRGVQRFIGTRYHYNDSYRTVMEAGTVSPRLYPATVDGKVEGEPVFMSRKALAQKRRDMGPYVFGAQMLQDPTADEQQGFKEAWLNYAGVTTRGHNLAILVDPASRKKPPSAKMSNDYTAIWVVGLGPDKKLYVHDMVRDRLNLTERSDRLITLHRYWSSKAPVLAVAYEDYGMQADIEHIQSEMERENYRFTITAVGGRLSKPDRIRRLIPWFEQGRIYLPPKLGKTNYEGREIDLVQSFVQDEYLPFPVGTHDDMLDALSRITEPDLPVAWPAPYLGDDEEEMEPTHGRNSTTGY